MTSIRQRAPRARRLSVCPVRLLALPGRFRTPNTIRHVSDQPGTARTVVTVWLCGGPQHGDSKDVSIPLPPTITTSSNEVYARVGPELDESGRPLPTCHYRWQPQLTLEAPPDH